MRAVIPLRDAARARGFDPERLGEGTGCTHAEPSNPRGRVSWAAYARFLSNLGMMFDDAGPIAPAGQPTCSV